MDFDEDIRQFILAHLPHDPQDRAELMAMDAHTILVTYWDWTRRFVTLTPRTVHRSKALDANPYATDPGYKPALDHIIASLEAGKDIGPHLSRGIMVGYESPTRLAQSATQSSTSATGRNKRIKRKTRRDLDLMLNDWGIHHLHLSTQMETDGWVTRAGPVLFAVFEPQDAYLIDIAPHGSWYHDDFIRIIVLEWLDAGIVHEVQGMTVPALSTEQRKGYRDRYAVTGILIDGRSYFPVVSLKSSGHAEQSVDAADAVSRTMKPVEAQLRASPERIVEILTAREVTPPPEPDVHFEFYSEGGYGIVERKTGTRFPFPVTQ